MCEHEVTLCQDPNSGQQEGRTPDAAPVADPRKRKGAREAEARREKDAVSWP